VPQDRIGEITGDVIIVRDVGNDLIDLNNLGRFHIHHA